MGVSIKGPVFFEIPKHTFVGIGHFSTDFAQILNGVIFWPADSENIFKVGNFGSISRL